MPENQTGKKQYWKVSGIPPYRILIPAAHQEKKRTLNDVQNERHKEQTDKAKRKTTGKQQACLNCIFFSKMCRKIYVDGVERTSLLISLIKF